MSHPRRALFSPTIRWLAAGLVLLGLIVIPYLLLDRAATSAGQTLLADAQARPWLAGSLIILLLALDVLLPVPSSIVGTAAGAAFGWMVGGVLIWVGLTLGCALGYWIGARAARPLAGKLVGEGEMARARRLAGRIGATTLVLTRAVPVLAEAATIAGGAAGMPRARFMAVTGLANAGIALIQAGAGAAAFSSQSVLAAFGGAVAMPALAWLALRIFRPSLI
jgi:3-dehydroquinate synthase